MEIYQNEKVVGTLHMENEGLYAKIVCKTERSDKIRRIYLAYPYGSIYVGLCDRDGNLTTHIARKKLPEAFCAVASLRRLDRWLPWQGELDGVSVKNALIGEHAIALYSEEAVKFPAWQFETEMIGADEMAVLALDEQGQPQPKLREMALAEMKDLQDTEEKGEPICEAFPP